MPNFRAKSGKNGDCFDWEWESIWNMLFWASLFYLKLFPSGICGTKYCTLEDFSLRCNLCCQKEPERAPVMKERSAVTLSSRTLSYQTNKLDLRKLRTLSTSAFPEGNREGLNKLLDRGEILFLVGLGLIVILVSKYVCSDVCAANLHHSRFGLVKYATRSGENFHRLSKFDHVHVLHSILH